MNKGEKRKIPKEQLDQPEINALVDQADQLHAIKTLKDTDGGQELCRLLATDIINTVHHLSNKYRTASHTDLQALCANVEVQLNLLRLLNNAKDSLDEVNAQLDEALRE